jgi:hypothetical protein
VHDALDAGDAVQQVEPEVALERASIRRHESRIPQTTLNQNFLKRESVKPVRSVASLIGGIIEIGVVFLPPAEFATIVR